MKRLLYIIIGIVWTLDMSAQEVSTKADSTFIAGVLAEARRLPRSTNFPLHFAAKFMGRPYVAHT